MAQRWLLLFVGVLGSVSFASGCGRESSSTPAQSTPRPDEIVPAEPPAVANAATNAPPQQPAAVASPAPGMDTSAKSMTTTSTSSDTRAKTYPPNSSSGPPLTDAQIAGITKAANATEVDQAKLAHAKAKHQKTKEFAELMIAHHQAAEQAQAKLGISAADSQIVTQLDVDAASTMSKLKAAAGDFDRAYIDAQVEAHRSLLSLIDDQLLPNAKNPELRGYLEDIRTKAKMHLKKAEDTQQELAGASSALRTKGTRKDMSAASATQ